MRSRAVLLHQTNLTGLNKHPSLLGMLRNILVQISKRIKCALRIVYL